MASATLNGLLADDGGEPCDCWFEWGASTAYGMSTGHQYGLVTGNTFSAVITSLREGTMYHFRACAQNSSGITYGNDMIFVTLEPAGMMVLLPQELADLLGGR